MLVLVHVIMIKGAPIALDSGLRILLHVKPKVIAWVINKLNGIRNVNNLVGRYVLHALDLGLKGLKTRMEGLGYVQKARMSSLASGTLHMMSSFVPLQT